MFYRGNPYTALGIIMSHNPNTKCTGSEDIVVNSSPRIQPTLTTHTLMTSPLSVTPRLVKAPSVCPLTRKLAVMIDGEGKKQSVQLYDRTTSPWKASSPRLAISINSSNCLRESRLCKYVTTPGLEVHVSLQYTMSMTLC